MLPCSGVARGVFTEDFQGELPGQHFKREISTPHETLLLGLVAASLP